MRSCQKLAAAVALLLGLGGVVDAAPVSAITITNQSGFGIDNPPFTLGWSFTTSGDILVTDLGIFDAGLDGLIESHEIGLWDASGTLVASATLASGMSGTLVDNFRFASIAPVSLAAGSYTIGALYVLGEEQLIFPGFAEGFSAAPPVDFLGALFVNGGALARPTVPPDGSDPSYFGPNFRFESSGEPIPEPATIVLLAGGLACLARRRRRCA